MSGMHHSHIESVHSSIVAGCSQATTLLRVFVVRVLDKVVRRNPNIRLDVIVDDITMSAIGRGVQPVVDTNNGSQQLLE